MKLEPLQFAPGINKEGTEDSADYQWYDSDRVRFKNGFPKTINGWNYYIADGFYGIGRFLYNYTSIDAVDYLGIGTTQKLYIETGGTISDITPIRSTTSAGDVTFAATNGSTTITVTDTLHGAVLGDWVTYSGASGLGGNITSGILNDEHQITAINSDNEYEFEASVAANASDTGNGGASVVGAYQINIGLDFYVSSVGYGYGLFGSGTYGSSPAYSISDQLRGWSIDNYGDDMVSCIRGGGLYYWDESSGTGTRAVNFTALGGASSVPVAALQVMVSDRDRHVIAFGSNPIGSSIIDPLFVRWSDKENAADWQPTAINSSGGVTLGIGSLIVGALQTRQEIVIWTNSSIHSMRYVGGNFVFSFDLIAAGASMISPHAAATIGDTVYFMDDGGFYVYSGSVRRIPCSMNSFVFSNLDKDQRYKIFAYVDEDNNEITWQYPTLSSSNGECDRYITYNYIENLWYGGTMSRGHWAGMPNKQSAVATSAVQDIFTATNYLYYQEIGESDENGDSIGSYIESGYFESGSGESFLYIGEVVPDLEYTGTGGNILITLKGKDYPDQTESTLDSGSVMKGSTNKIDVRARARLMKIRFETSDTNFGWKIGTIRARMRTDGRR